MEEIDLEAFFRIPRLDDIVSGPILAAIRANHAADREQIKFLLKYCFDIITPSPPSIQPIIYRPKLIPMSLTKSYVIPASPPQEDLNFKKNTIIFNVPLITLIPFNALSVTKVQVGFGVDLSYSETTNDNSTESESIQLFGKLSSGHSNFESLGNPQQTTTGNQSDRTLDINIEIGQVPLSNGLRTLIDLYSKAIQPAAGSEDDIF